ncbi:hypothetical protein LTR09_000976 [Extremus antarcticus]|uniref:Peptidase A1 domain-containing protein n=1 Tax=Extremus antarcticus TaxID=702011 RepID=A0AAJ0GI10_9PEZI|nr:hypothetical protein LTR09_000976 [Extremus antarcticus]
MPFNPSQLTRVQLRKNPNYQRHGRKSYAYALQKCTHSPSPLLSQSTDLKQDNIGPTLEGPFAMIDQIEQTGSQAVMRTIGKKIGGKAYSKGQTLVMRDASGKSVPVPTTDVQHDSMYLSDVGVGTPKQMLKLDFDTGSADCWVWSSELEPAVKTQGKATGHAIFDTTKSGTWKPESGSTWQIQYGDGSGASGTVGKDTLTVGGLCVENQAIETANKMSARFEQNTGDGLLGLAWGKINQVRPVQAKTPVENMISQKDIPQTAELFTAYLGSYRDKANPDHGESFYTFGYIDQDVLKASGVTEPYYCPVDDSQGFWQFSSATATVNGHIIDRSSNSAIADTGTTLALVSDDLCEQIYAAIPGAKKDKFQQGWVFPLSVPIEKLPTVQFAVGSKLFTVLGEDLQYAPTGDGFYYGGIQSRGDLPFDILGDTFLKNVYAIFDQGNKRFGCVQRIEPESKKVSSSPSGGQGTLGSSGAGLKDWFGKWLESLWKLLGFR